MLEIKLVNDGTGDEIAGNYDYYVYVNEKLIARGRVENHNRLSGWEGLVSCLARRVFSEEERDD